MTKQEALKAAVDWVLDDVYLISNCSMPRLVTMAALKIFMEKIPENKHTETIRHQLIQLETKAQFDYEGDSK